MMRGTPRRQVHVVQVELIAQSPRRVQAWGS